MPRIYCPLPLSEHAAVDLPERAVKHVQVLRFQPGDPLIVFNGRGGEYTATIEEMGRQKVSIQTHEHSPIERENAQRVHLIVGMPANERMDWLIEKATELGVNRITPLMTQSPPCTSFFIIVDVQLIMNRMVCMCMCVRVYRLQGRF